jgi:hypothetical protein
LVKYKYNRKAPPMRKPGYLGTIVSGEKLANIANNIYSLQYIKPSTCTVDDLLLIELSETDVFGDSKYALVCTEGVGWEQDEYGLITVPTNIGDFNWLNGKVDISVEVIKQCVTDITQDISQYVRTFGDRLDNNVWLWQNRMKEREMA